MPWAVRVRVPRPREWGGGGGGGGGPTSSVIAELPGAQRWEVIPGIGCLKAARFEILQRNVTAKKCHCRELSMLRAVNLQGCVHNND